MGHAGGGSRLARSSVTCLTVGSSKLPSRALKRRMIHEKSWRIGHGVLAGTCCTSSRFCQVRPQLVLVRLRQHMQWLSSTHDTFEHAWQPLADQTASGS